jgi:putative GTP pyrophosphokinase
VDKVRRRAAEAAEGVEGDGIPVVAYVNPLAQIEDQIGGRVLVFFRHDIQPVVDLLNNTFNSVEMQDKTPPKDPEFGYESTHVIYHIRDHLRPGSWTSENSMPETFELQVRTLFMHPWAEPRHNLGYKTPSDLTRNQRRHLARIAASAWGADRGLADARREIGLRRRAVDADVP